MLLSYIELVEIVERGVIRGVRPGAINGASIDVHLGPVILRETRRRANTEIYDDPRNRCHVVDLRKRETIATDEVRIDTPAGCVIRPGDFFLGSTQEEFHLPDDISCQFLLKSTIGRAGLNHMAATWADATWHSANLTLEFKNDTQWHSHIIGEGMPIGQIKFYKHTPVPAEHSYAARGRYNGDQGPKGGKP